MEFLYILDHLKFKNIPDFIPIINNQASYFRYLLNNYYNLNVNIIYKRDINIEKYKEKTLCLLNISNLFSRVFNDNILPLKNRKYDIVFLGNIHYDNLISKHRQDVILKLKEFKKKYNYNIFFGNDNSVKISLNEYYRILKKTKIFISPWGWGEWSLKEFECICLGCHVVIPYKHMENFPNFFENFDDFDIDFNNFESKLLYMLNNLDEIQHKVDLNRQLFKNYNLENQINILEKILLTE
jgi:hypothetical protein